MAMVSNYYACSPPSRIGDEITSKKNKSNKVLETCMKLCNAPINYYLSIYALLKNTYY
jgi:hypothetical protein